MTYYTENVFPGAEGKTFETNAKTPEALKKVANAIQNLEEVKGVTINSEKFPARLRVTSTTLLPIKVIEDAVKSIGFHAIPKNVL